MLGFRALREVGVTPEMLAAPAEQAFHDRALGATDRTLQLHAATTDLPRQAVQTPPSPEPAHDPGGRDRSHCVTITAGRAHRSSTTTGATSAFAART
jgi:hypothetical protein